MITREVLTIKVLATINRTHNLRKALTSILKDVSYDKVSSTNGGYFLDGSVDLSGIDGEVKVYYRKVPARTELPYLTYFLEHRKSENAYSYDFEVHIWSKDVKDAEEIADCIECIDNCIYSDEIQSFDIALERRLNVDDENKEIQHIVLNFEIEYYNKKG